MKVTEFTMHASNLVSIDEGKVKLARLPLRDEFVKGLRCWPNHRLNN